MDILLDTVRHEIAGCLVYAYEKISLEEAAKRLNLKTKDEVKEFGAAVRLNHLNPLQAMSVHKS